MSKLFLITRRDLPPADQAVQAAHALRQFVAEHPQIDLEWFTTSNTLAFLSVQNEQALGVLHRKAIDRIVPVAAFREPDRSDELTAIALGPSGKKLTKGLPLALKFESSMNPSTKHGHPQENEQDHEDKGRPVPLDRQPADI
jgi:Peptidyl-tRNA hydrolase PTH2